MTAATNAQRQAALKARRKAAGLVALTLWVYPEARAPLKKHAEAANRYLLTKINDKRMMRET